jgi:hypothetical protein
MRFPPANIFTGFIGKFPTGLRVSFLRIVISWTLVVLFPLSLFAGDAPSAVVHSKGGVWVNGAEVADSISIFPGDVLETKPGFVAELDVTGSAVLIRPESIVKFEGTALGLEHGSVSVGTSTMMRVHVNCIRVDPVSNDRTQFDVTDTTGTVRVAALKNDVNITQDGLRKTSSNSTSAQSASVHEGEQATRIEATSCGAPARPGTAGSGMNTKWLEVGGGAAGGVLVLCLLLCKSSTQSSVSPSQP